MRFESQQTIHGIPTVTIDDFEKLGRGESLCFSLLRIQRRWKPWTGQRVLIAGQGSAVVLVNSFLDNLPTNLICTGGEGTHGLLLKMSDGRIGVDLITWGASFSLPIAEQAVQLLSKAGLPAKIFGKK